MRIVSAAVARGPVLTLRDLCSILEGGAVTAKFTSPLDGDGGLGLFLVGDCTGELEEGCGPPTHPHVGLKASLCLGIRTPAPAISS